jgi:signal peptidase II
MPLVSRSSIKPPSAAESLTPEARVRWDVIVGAIALGVIIIDQITKRLIVAHFSGVHAHDVVPIFGNILSLEYTGNPGAAFSSFLNSPGLLGFLIAVAIAVIGWMYWSTRPRNNPWLKATFGLIIGGALGNLIDRVRLGYVVDFIHFQIPAIRFDFAIFNVADSAISVGVVMLAIIFWTLPRESEPTLAGAGDGGADAGTVALSQPEAKAVAIADAPAKPSSPPKSASTNGTTTKPTGSLANGSVPRANGTTPKLNGITPKANGTSPKTSSGANGVASKASIPAKASTGTTTTKTPTAPVKAPNGTAPKAVTAKTPTGASVPHPVATGAAKPAPRATTNRPSSKSKHKRH